MVSAMYPSAARSRTAASLHRVDPQELFEAELARRGLRHAADVRSGGCVVWVRGAKLAVSLDNLARQLTGDEGDAERVAWFTDQVIAAAGPAALTADGLVLVPGAERLPGQARLPGGRQPPAGPRPGARRPRRCADPLDHPARLERTGPVRR